MKARLRDLEQRRAPHFFRSRRAPEVEALGIEEAAAAALLRCSLTTPGRGEGRRVPMIFLEFEFIRSYLLFTNCKVSLFLAIKFWKF